MSIVLLRCIVLTFVSFVWMLPIVIIRTWKWQFDESRTLWRGSPRNGWQRCDRGHDRLSKWGADSVRVGIGGGSICSTRIQTGHGMPTFQSVLDCSQSECDTTIIADGGITTAGDIVKALAAGADFVILGSLLAGTNETPGEVFKSKKGKEYKVYRGMASKEAQKDWRGSFSSNEGGLQQWILGPVAPLDDLANGIRSGLSYSGARTIFELQAKAEFVRQTASGQVESSTHILRQ